MMKYLLYAVATIAILAGATGSAYAQEISIICNDENGNYFEVVRRNPIDCFVYPSELTPDGPGIVTITASNGKVVLFQQVDQSGVTQVSFIPKKAGSYAITASWEVSGEVHSATGNIIVLKSYR